MLKHKFDDKIKHKIPIINSSEWTKFDKILIGTKMLSYFPMKSKLYEILQENIRSQNAFKLSSNKRGDEIN